MQKKKRKKKKKKKRTLKVLFAILGKAGFYLFICF